MATVRFIVSLSWNAADEPYIIILTQPLATTIFIPQNALFPHAFSASNIPLSTSLRNFAFLKKVDQLPSENCRVLYKPHPVSKKNKTIITTYVPKTPFCTPVYWS